MLLADIAVTAGNGVGFIKISKEQLAAAAGGVRAIVDHAVDAMLILCQSFLVNLGSECQLLSFYSWKEVGDGSDTLAGDVVYDAFGIEGFERMINFVFGEVAILS